MKKMTKKELKSLLDDFRNKEGEAYLDLTYISMRTKKLEGMDFSRVDFSNSDFKDVNFKSCKFDNAKLQYTKFENCDLSGSSFAYADLFSADLRTCDLSGSNFDGADFFAALLWEAKLDNLFVTDRTKFFRNYCPEEGYIFGYKKCFNERMVQLLIPKDAKRCSSTTNACRCDKARVVAITDVNKKESYKEAMSFVDPNFIYRLGEMVYADSYNEDRWHDSSHGIHFWMTFEEALGYM
jgi:pentapeptide repeat family protein